MNSEKRKLPRFQITPCQFHSDKSYSIQDISLGGLALRLVERSDLAAFAVGTQHKGTVKVEGLKTECTFVVRYLRGLTVGGEWIAPSATLTQHLTHILNPKTLGESIKNYPVPDSPNLEWFHTPVGVDLLLYKTDSMLNRWILYFHQTFLQWEVDSGLKSGKTLAEDDEGYAHGVVRLETRMLEYDPEVDRTLLETARDFIAAAKSVEHSARALISGQIGSQISGLNAGGIKS